MSIDFGPRSYDPCDYDDYEDNHPIVLLYRYEYEAHQRMHRRIDALLDSLTPADAAAELYSFAERKLFGIYPHRKRPRER